MLSPIRIILIFILLSLGCIIAIPKLNVDLLPKSNSNRLNLSFSIYGSTPEETEQQVTSILENACSKIRNLKKINSVSTERMGLIQLYFDKNEDIDFKRLEVNALIRQLRPMLPASVSNLSLSQNTDSKNSMPLLIYSFHADGNTAQVKEQAEELIKTEINTIRGVKLVEVTGIQGQQVTIKYDLEKLKAFNVDVPSIAKAINQYTFQTYPGMVRTADHLLSFVTIASPEADINSLSDILVVREGSSIPIKLKDIATIEIEEKEIQKYFRINGENAVNINIYAQEGVNAVKLAQELQQKVNQLSTQYQALASLKLNYDHTAFLAKEINKNYQRTAIAMCILLLFIFIAYRNYKNVLILFFSLCVNLCLTLIVVWALNLAIHIYTLASLAIAFGFMIDHSIVMLDYYNQYQHKKIFPALIAASLTTIAALLLFIFLPEDQKNNFREFSMVLIIALSCSLLTNFYFTVSLRNFLFGTEPKETTLNYRLKKRKYKQKMHYAKVIAFVASYRKIFITIIIFSFGVPLFMLPARIENVAIYNRSIGSDYFQQNILPKLNLVFGGTLRLFKDNIYEGSSYKEIGQSKLYVYAELPIGNTIAQMNAILIEFEKELANEAAISQYITTIHSGQSATIEVSFKEQFENGARPAELKNQLITRAIDWAGVNWNIFGIGNSFSQRSSEDVPSFKVKMMGYNYDQLEQQAKSLAEKLSPNKRVQNINIDDRLNQGNKRGQEYTLDINTTMANISGTNPKEIYNTLSSRAKQYGFINNLAIDKKIYPIMIKSNTDETFSEWDMLNEQIAVNETNSFKLKQYGEVKLKQTAGSINKENRQYIRILSFEYLGTESIGNDFLSQKLAALKQEMPNGYTAVKDIQQFGSNTLPLRYELIILLIIANFIICSMLFEELRQPLYIIATIPVSFIGLFLIFYLFKFPFDQGGYAAFVMLCGLVANGGIFMVNDYNQLLRSNKKEIGANQHLIKAIFNRSRTIILTIIALGCGMVPFLFDGVNEVFWFPLAIGTIGGLLFSFIALFLVLPVCLWQKHNQ